MKPTPPLAASGPKPKASRFDGFWPAVLIVLAGAAAYANSFSGPFIFDDRFAIAGNSSIRHFATALLPSPDATTAGRPLLNLTFALNYAMGGMDVRGYHIFNLFIHVLAGLTLFGIVRRTLRERPTSNSNDPGIQKSRFGGDATLLALAVSVIWVVHPLQTEAVTYISERAESLMGLFYLLTLYCFVRGAGAAGEGREARGKRPEDSTTALNSQLPTLSSRLWMVSSIFACLLGVMSKEITVTVPVIILLYDRTFIAGSFRDAWRQHWRYYLGLAGTWLLLAHLMTGLDKRAAVGFDEGVTWWSYALTSCRSVVRYLELAIWPHPLVLDYGFNAVHDAITVLPFMLVLVVLAAGVVISLWRWPMVGFAGAWFFLILAPTTSIVPVVEQPMAEHRMYLPLAAVVVLIVFGLHRLLGRRSFPGLLALAAVFGWLTSQRNETYRTEERIWRDTVAKCPGNARAHYNLGTSLMEPSQSQEAIAEYEAALQLKPDYTDAHINLGDVLFAEGRTAEAIAQDEEAVRLKPNYAEAHNNLGNALSAEGRTDEAIAQCEEALRLKPDLAEAHKNLGDALNAEGRTAEAIAQDEEALRLRPDYVEAHNNLGDILFAEGHTAEAIAHYEEAVRLKPNYAEAHDNLGIALKAEGRTAEAIAQCEEALRLKPDLAEAHKNWGDALKSGGRTTEAIAQYEEALRLKPDYADAHINLGNALSAEGRTAEAIAQDEEAVRLKPDYAEAHNNLGSDLSAEGRIAEAIAQYEEAVRLKPNLAKAHKNLGDALKAGGRTAEAITQYDEAVRLKPDYAEARNNLGNALSAEGRTAEAIAQYEEAVRFQPDIASIHFNLALALLKIPDRTNEAATHLREVLRLQPDNDQARKILASMAASGP